MSRVGKKPVELPKGVEVTASDAAIRVKGPKGELTLALNPQVEVKVANGLAQVETRSAARTARVVSGTTRALLANMITGVTKGFERKLELVGVGYRAQAQGRKLNLTLGSRCLPGARGHHGGNAEPDRDYRQGHGSAEGRTGCGGDPPVSLTGTLQGQGCAVRQREGRPQGSQEEVGVARRPH